MKLSRPVPAVEIARKGAIRRVGRKKLARRKYLRVKRAKSTIWIGRKTRIRMLLCNSE